MLKPNHYIYNSISKRINSGAKYQTAANEALAPYPRSKPHTVTTRAAKSREPAHNRGQLFRTAIRSR